MTVRVQTEDFDIGAELEKLSAGNHQIGGVADLVLCGTDPLTADRAELSRMPVAATLLRGSLTHVE